MSFKNTLVIVLTFLVIFISFTYSFGAIEVKYNVSIDGDMATVTSAVYGTSEEESAGVSVSFEVYGGLNGFKDIFNKKAGAIYDSYTDGFYRYGLETFTFPVRGDNYQCRVVYVGPPQPALQFSGTVFLPDGKTPFTGGGLVVVNTEYDYFGDYRIKEDGTYSIRGLKDGTYNLRAIPAIKSKYSKSFNVKIKISGGKLISTENPVNILLTDTQYSGTVVKPNGTTPFTEGWIDVITRDRYVDSLQIGLDGSFTCGGLSDGTYYLKARPFDGSGDVCTSTEVEIRIRGGKPSSPIGVLKLTMSVPQLKGHVVTPDGNAVEYTGIAVFDENNTFVDSAFSGTGGVFKIAGLSDGYYK
ncbi:MAG: hypothetical protein GX660_10845, partial [Clostridiaceae bacterium]|nr:hypothetical protein [Clostridiaceae bacterium]